MAWTDGVDQVTGFLVTASTWNSYLGASSSLMVLKAHAHGGATGEGTQSVGPLVLEDFTDATAPAAPGAGKTRIYSTAGRMRYRAGAAGANLPLGGPPDWTAATDGATITFDLSQGTRQTVTLGGNRTVAAPTNANSGDEFIFRIVQDGTGGRTLSWNAAFKFPAGVAPTLTATAGKADFIGGKYDGTNFQVLSITTNV